MSTETIKPEELYRRGQSIYLLDVRTPTEFSQQHAANAVNLPLGDLQRGAPLPPDLCQAVGLLCQSGTRAREAAQLLERRDSQLQLLVAEGGTEGWRAAGLPVVHGVSLGWTIERQVRLVVGCLILLAVTLNRMGMDAAIYLAGLIGLGLAFAGLTNTCGMALLLTQMPWNRRKV